MLVEMTRSRPPVRQPRPDQMNPSDLTGRVPVKAGAIRCGLMLGSPLHGMKPSVAGEVTLAGCRARPWLRDGLHPLLAQRHVQIVDQLCRKCLRLEDDFRWIVLFRDGYPFIGVLIPNKGCGCSILAKSTFVKVGVIHDNFCNFVCISIKEVAGEFTEFL
jgi:hypothetical protein